MKGGVANVNELQTICATTSHFNRHIINDIVGKIAILDIHMEGSITGCAETKEGWYGIGVKRGVAEDDRVGD